MEIQPGDDEIVPFSFDDEDKIGMIDYFIISMDSANEWLRRAYALEGLKKLLQIRYTARLMYKKSLIQKTNSDIKMIFRKISAKELKISVYMMYKLFYLFPWIYHLFRLIKDPTMIKVEKRIKAGKSG